MSLEFLGALRRDEAQLAEAIKLFTRALDSGDLNPRGKADMWRQIADAHKHKSDWTAAGEAYGQAIAILPAPIYEVLRSECFLRMGKLDEAISSITKTQNQALEGPERVDYAFALAAIAIEGNKRELLDRAKEVLQTLEVPEPYFRERRDSFLLNVMEAINSGPSKSLIARTRELLATIAKATSSYLVLQPNIMGIGVDINKAFNDFSSSVKRSEKHSEKSSKEGKSHR